MREDAVGPGADAVVEDADVIGETMIVIEV